MGIEKGYAYLHYTTSYKRPLLMPRLLILRSAWFALYPKQFSAVYTLLPGISSSTHGMKLKLTLDILLSKKRFRSITSSLWLPDINTTYRLEMKWRPDPISLPFPSNFVGCIGMTKLWHQWLSHDLVTIGRPRAKWRPSSRVQTSNFNFTNFKLC